MSSTTCESLGTDKSSKLTQLKALAYKSELDRASAALQTTSKTFSQLVKVKKRPASSTTTTPDSDLNNYSVNSRAAGKLEAANQARDLSAHDTVKAASNTESQFHSEAKGNASETSSTEKNQKRESLSLIGAYSDSSSNAEDST